MEDATIGAAECDFRRVHRIGRSVPRGPVRCGAWASGVELGRWNSRHEAAFDVGFLLSVYPLGQVLVILYPAETSPEAYARIADRLFLSEATVKGYVSRMLVKLECANRTQVGILAYDAGLVTR